MRQTLWRALVAPVFAIRTARELRGYVRTDPSVEDCLQFIRTSHTRGDCDIRITQKDSEIHALCAELTALAPKALVEIGTEGGGTLFLFSALAADGATIVSVDLPRPFGGYRRHRALLYRAFARRGQRLELLRCDSHDPATQASVVRLLGRTQLDFLFIDGDHSLAGVRRDYELYGPLVRPGGLIAFHDIVPGAGAGGAPDFWQELKRTTPHATEELVEDWSQDGFGIGVLRIQCEARHHG